jgi:hypothetical protein
VADNKIVRTGFMTEIDQFLRDYDKNRKTLPDSVRKEAEKAKAIALKRDQFIDEAVNPIFKDF